ncbi:MAG: response regulator [Desulfobacteraceae bacterium]|nr:response regulator [Desulfobacteraceae bacterium]
MDKVLIVDNDRESISKVRQGFRDLHHFELLTATNVKSATDILRSTRISVLATTIHLPQQDGLELLAFMSRNFPSTPCIVLLEETDPKPWFTDRTGHTGVLYFLKKPFSFGRLASAIFVGLNLRDEGQTRYGIHMKNFLPLIAIADKTCRLEVRSGTREKGYLYFLKGELLNARVDNLEGDESAKRIAGWQGAQLDFSPLPAENRKYRVHMDLLTLARAAWEKGARPGQEKKKKEETEGFVENRSNTRLEEALYKHAGIIRTAKGYRGMAVANSEGGVLASDIPNGVQLDFSSIAQAVSHMYTDCSKHWSRKGLGMCRGLSLHTELGIVIMHCTDFYTSGNYRFIVLMAEDGNSFFVQTQLKTAIPRIISEIF